MTKKLRILSIIIIVSLVFSFSVVAGAQSAAPAEWNVLVYLAADNDLSDYAEIDIVKLMSVEPSDDVNILVFVDTLDAPAYLYKIGHGVKEEEVAFAWNGVEAHMGDPETLKDFLGYVSENYQANHTALFFWNHGGPYGICSDWNRPAGTSSRMTHGEVADVLAEADKIDILAYDMCRVGQIEVMYEYVSRGVQTDYIVASQGFISWRGFPYDTIVSRLVAEGLDARELAEAIAVEFENYLNKPPYMSEVQTSQSVIQLDKIAELTHNLHLLSNALNADLNRGLITVARSRGNQSWGNQNWIDLKSFVEHIERAAKDAEIRSLSQTVLEQLEAAVIATGSTQVTKNLGGLGIYFPTKGQRAITPYESGFSFANHEDGWLQMLESYWGK